MPKKIKIKNSLPHLLSAVCRHEDCPDWLDTEIWNLINNRAQIESLSPKYFALMLKYAPTVKDERREKEAEQSETEEPEIERTDATAQGDETEIDNLALLLSGILNNPKLPSEIYNGLKRGLNDVFNDLSVDRSRELSEYEDSPAYLAKLIKNAEDLK